MDGGDDVGDCQASSRSQRGCRRLKHHLLVRGEVDDSVGYDAIDGRVVHGGPLDVAVAELDAGGAHGRGDIACLGQLGCGHVHPDHTTGRTGGSGGEKAVGARTAAQVENRFAGLDCGQVEEVADTGEGLDRASRHRVELAGRVAEPFGQGATGFEVELAVRFAGYLLV